jgi:hypothetical protein
MDVLREYPGANTDQNRIQELARRFEESVFGAATSQVILKLKFKIF